MELYAQVRRSVFVEGLSEREAARRFGIARETVRKMLRYATPPGYQRSKPVRRSKLDPYTGIIDQILADDREQPRKQRHTAKRIHERLREEYGFDGGYSSVKEYVREQKLASQEMFVPLAHPPGDAQADFWRGGGRHRRSTAQGALPGRRSAAQRRCVREGVSGRDDRGVLRRAQRGVWLLRGRAAPDRLRQHEAGGGEDPRRRNSSTDASLPLPSD